MFVNFSCLIYSKISREKYCCSRSILYRNQQEKIRKKSIEEIEEGVALSDEEFDKKKKAITERTRDEEGGVEKKFEEWKKETNKEED